jgi:hypothetical protein
VWDRLRRQVSVEWEQLQRLIDTHRPLLAKCATTAPDPIELSALAAMLHSFYTGVENPFKRVAIEVDGSVPGGDTWHRELLDQMAAPTATRSPVISGSTRDALRPYLQFRHVLRHAYSFDLRWDKMAQLVLRCEGTLATLKSELDRYLQETR